MEEKLDEKVYCICGNDFILTVPSIYGPDETIYCNKCMITVPPSEVIYHCPRMNIHQHPTGYDLCNFCFERTRRSILNSQTLHYGSNGIIYWLATNKGKSIWNNPADTGTVSVSSSKLTHESESLSAIVGLAAKKCATITSRKAWMAVNLKDIHVKLTHYSLRHWNSWDKDANRNWDLEGSHDGNLWTVISRHRDDTGLKKTSEWYTWIVDGKQYFNHFRINIKGRNSNHHWFLACSGIELYGAIFGGDTFLPQWEQYGSDGIIYWLGTNRGKSVWKNPADIDNVRITASSGRYHFQHSEPLSLIVNNAPTGYITSGHNNEWIALHLKETRVKLTHYSLRHDTSSYGVLRNWNLEGSNDGYSWSVIRKHRNDTRLKSNHWQAWSVDAKQYFNYFRIYMEGENSSKQLYLKCAGIELYGAILYGGTFVPPWLSLNKVMHVSDKSLSIKSKKCKKSSTASWICRFCTLVNANDVTQCAACETSRPQMDQKDSTDFIGCNASGNCVILERLKNTMKHHKEQINCLVSAGAADDENKEIFIENNLGQNMQQSLDDFLHLLSKHNSDQQFELIANLLGDCDINQCAIFERNHRNKTLLKNSNLKRNELYKTVNHEDVAYQQLLDKIHCFWSHCYDIGNKISSKEKQVINEMNEQRDDFQNPAVKTLHTLLCRKKKNIKNLDILNDQMTKYNQLAEQKVQDTNSNVYSFGHKFNYGYGTEKWAEDGTVVYAKHESLKDELLTNKVSTISMEQFNTEHQKAMIHFNSRFRKEHFPQTSILLQHILSLIIYCNYDELQFEFSKTYRVNINEHNNFYHLAKYLKMVVKEFGTEMKKGNISTLYHGIGEQLVFPQYVAHLKDHRKPQYGGVAIHGPLSTSSSFEVATNFTNNNNGLIIQFGCNPSSKKSAKYFSVSWLSDYGNESEHLFIQNNDNTMESLDICNIFDAREGYQFDMILNAIKIIEKITNFNNLAYNAFHDYVSLRIQRLIIKILHHQLSSLQKYKSFDALHNNEYAKQIIKTYCNNKKYLDIDYCFMEKNGSDYNFLFELLFHKKYQWIKLKEISILFPNIKRIAIRNINLCSVIFEDIIAYLKNHDNISIISIYPNKNSDISAIYAVSKYKQQFTEIKSGKFGIPYWDMLSDTIHVNNQQVVMIRNLSEIIATNGANLQ